MDEYISREETVKAFCEKCRGYYDGHCIHRIECDVDVIQTAPAADVEPVRHGRWVCVEAEPEKVWCDYCKTDYRSSDLLNIGADSGKVNFCPNCGARMGED